MNLYLLKLKVGLASNWDVAQGFVVVAPSAPTARRFAAENAMDEGRRTWFIPEETSCELIGEAKADQKAGIVLRDTDAF